MTLALYGKSRRRQGGLLLGALLAILAASVGGLAIITSVFAHHLENTITTPTCQNQNWEVTVFEGQWSNYREAVLTVTDPTTPVALRFSPYLDNGFSDTILTASGTGAVHTAGKVEQFTGDFTTWTDTSNTNISDSITALVHSNSLAWNTEFTVGRVILWDNELMKITARSADGKTLTVERGFGDTDPVLHTSNAQGVWKRGALEGSPNTVTWNLQFDPSSCGKKIIVKKVTVNDPGATSFAADINNTDGSSGDQTNKAFSVASPYTDAFTGGADSDDFTVTEQTPPANWALTGKTVLNGDVACPAAGGSWTAADNTASGRQASGGFLNNVAIGETVTVCFRNVYTAPSQTTVDKYNDSDGTPNLGESFNYKLKFSVTGSATTSNFVAADQVPAVYTVGTVSPNSAATPLHCAKSGNLVTCTLNSGAAVGDYIATIPVTVPANATCGPVVNDVFKDSTTSGNKLDTDTVNISGCGSLNIDKSNATKVGNTLQWTITVTNTSSVAKTALVFDPNTSLVSETCTNVVSENPADYYSCDVAGNSSAQLVLSTVYPGHSDVCQPLDVNNTAYLAVSTTAGSSGATGSDGGTYHEDASQSASCVTIDKANATKVGNTLQWVVTLTNTSGIAQTVAVHDTQATTLVSEDCTNVVANSDPYSCTVPANGVAHLTLSTPYGGTGAVCDGYQTSNTAWINGNQNASDTAQYSETAQPDKSCITVTKEKTQTSQPPTWTISIANTGDAAQGLFVKDAGATYGGNNAGGSCTATVGVTAMDAPGILCTVNANSTLVITVSKATPAATCEGTDVSNTAQVWVGVFPAPPSGAPDFTADGGTFTGVGKDTELCNKLIQITKFYQLADGTPIGALYTPGAADRPTFKLSPNPWGAGDYTVVDDANCDMVLEGNSKLVWECTVPVAWNGTVSEQAAVNWVQSFNGACTLELVQLDKQIAGLVQSALAVVIEAQIAPANSFSFCNYPVGTIRIIKNDLTTAGNTARPADADWDFTASGPNAFSQARAIALGGGNVVIPNVPLGNGYSAVENDGSYDACRIDGPAGIHQYFTTNLEDGPLNITQPGQEITFTFRNEDCGAVLGTGSLNVFKVRDINGNGTMDGSDTNIVWTVTIQGPEFPGGQVFNVPAAGLHLNGITEGLYTITESSQSGYALVGVKTSENVNLVVSASTSVTVSDGQEDTVTFYNKPSGQIPVHKNAFTSHNGGPNVAAPNDDDGWTITLTSAQCGINQVKVTDVNGDALFTDLPLCTDYVVTEGAVNVSSPGFVPLTPAQFTNITPNGVTLTFNNILRTNDPICTVGCIPTSTPTPNTPTATPTTPTTTTTATPPTSTATPTNTPSPVSTQAGERTPGPGQPTPIAPSTGGGVLGNTTGGFNLLLVLAGILALSSGVSFLALGRKNRR